MESEDDHRDPWELTPFYVALAAVFALAYLEVGFAAPPVSTARPVATYNQAAAAFLYGPKELARAPACAGTKHGGKSTNSAPTPDRYKDTLLTGEASAGRLCGVIWFAVGSQKSGSISSLARGGMEAHI